MAKLGVGSGELAKLCGVHITTVSRWKAAASDPGALPVPIYAETILRLLKHVKALEDHYRIPPASRLSTGSRARRAQSTRARPESGPGPDGSRKGIPAVEEARANGPQTPREARTAA